MKSKSLLSILSLGLLTLALQSCENQDVEFPDYTNSAVYFAYQNPVRTLVLGEDENFDTSLDNAHQCEIYAVLSGMYSNKGNVTVGIQADNSLCDNLYFADGTAVKAMPSTYYSLAGNSIVMDGTMNGCVKVQFTDAFFADKDAIKNTYVIPLKMTGVQGADSILVGKAKSANAVRTNAEDWEVLPQDYVLYCVKFINPWSGSYLRRGVDVVTSNGKSTTTVRHKATVEKDDVFTITTSGLKTVLYPFSSTCKLLLTFNDDNTCTVTSATDGFTATGKGTFMKDSEKKAWGNKDRDALYLDYQVVANGVTTATKDTLVARDRGLSGIETFSTIYKK
jgi:hypothetical protein